jgi:hypothetical protein
MELVSRRSFCWKIGLGSLTLNSLVHAQARYAIQNCVTKWSYSSQKIYKDPFNEVELDVAFTDPQGL